MTTNDASKPSQPKTDHSLPDFFRVGESLWRSRSSGTYYGYVVRNGKQHKTALRTESGAAIKDRAMADRALAEWLTSINKLSPVNAAPESFQRLADEWMASLCHTWKGKADGGTARYYKYCVQGLAEFFRENGVDVKPRDINASHCARWKTERKTKSGGGIKDRTFVAELRTMKAIFDWAIERGYMLRNPAAAIKGIKIKSKKPSTPTQAEFFALVADIRKSRISGYKRTAEHTGGLEDNQAKSQHSADMVELMGFSGTRVSEAASIRWRDVDFDKNTLTINGEPGEDPRDTGTKNGETRTIPLFPALRGLLERLKKEAEEQDVFSPMGFICAHKGCRTALIHAAKRLNSKIWTHHDFRHFFTTTCVEAGIDIPTISKWLGHKDGGALLMKVYNHTRDEHSQLMAQRVQFGAATAQPSRMASLEIAQAAA